MKGLAARSSHHPRAAAAAAEMPRAIQSGLGSESRKMSRAVIAVPKPATPGRSIRVTTSRAEWPPSRSGSFAIQRSAMAKARQATGTLTRNAARQLNQPINSPPIVGPIATVAAPAMARPPRTPLGGEFKPTAAARRRISSMADG